MSTTIEPVQEVALQEETGYQLVAIDGPQLKNAHAKMIEWAKEMQSKCDVEAAEESENLRIAEDRKWSTAPFRKRVALIAKRRTFYEKIEIALIAGYVIVPNFEMTVFAIRTKRDTPMAAHSTSSWSTIPNPRADLLAAGEGEYHNPNVPTYQRQDKEPDGKGGTKEVTYRWRGSEFSEMDFPIALAKPVLMSSTAEAMAAKVFDEVGVATDTRWRGRRAGDPFILGRLRNPRNGHSDITFFIGWYFDPRNL